MPSSSDFEVFHPGASKVLQAALAFVVIYRDSGVYIAGVDRRTVVQALDVLESAVREWQEALRDAR